MRVLGKEEPATTRYRPPFFTEQSQDTMDTSILMSDLPSPKNQQQEQYNVTGRSTGLNVQQRYRPELDRMNSADADAEVVRILDMYRPPSSAWPIPPHNY